MFKGRLWVWIFVIALCVGIPYLIDNVPKWMETTEIFISPEVEDVNIAENLLDYRYGKYKVKTASSNNDIIISSTIDEIPPNYTKKEKMISSPIVMYVYSNINNYNDGFIDVGNGNSCYKIDLMTILNAMEKEKTWQDIGVDEHLLNGEIVLYIPNESSWYYKEIENLFYITLNNGKLPNDNELKELQPRVEALLKKCEKVISIEVEIEKEAYEPSEKGKVFIAPEFLFQTAKGMGTVGNSYYVPVYFLKTTFVSADFYIKNDSKIADDFIEIIQNKPKFMEDTGWRVQNSTFNINNISNHYMKMPK